MPYFFLITVLSNDLQNFQIFYIYHSSQQTFLVFQDVFKTSWRRLQRNTFRLPRRLQDVFKTYLQYVFQKRLQGVFKMSSQDVFKTFSRRFQNVLARLFFKTTSRRRLATMSRRHLQDVFKTSCKTKKCYTEDVFKTSSRRLQYVFTKTNVCWVRMTTNIGARIFINKLF